jgi:hypothetical protein
MVDSTVKCPYFRTLDFDPTAGVSFIVRYVKSCKKSTLNPEVSYSQHTENSENAFVPAILQAGLSFAIK